MALRLELNGAPFSAEGLKSTKKVGRETALRCRAVLSQTRRQHSKGNRVVSSTTIPRVWHSIAAVNSSVPSIRAQTRGFIRR